MPAGHRSPNYIGRINAEGLHWCWRCTSYREREEFPRELDHRCGSRAECTVCRRLRRYGLTRETFALIPGADGICALCAKAPSAHIDHDHRCCPGRHSCGKCVRAVLCIDCNLVTGRVEALHLQGRLPGVLEHLGIALGIAS